MGEIEYTDNTLMTDFEVIETDAQTAAQDTGDTNTLYPYDPMKINISNYSWSVDTIRQMLNRKLIIISPNFRTNFVWDYTKKSRLIESILLGIPIPAFYLVKNEKGVNVLRNGEYEFKILSTLLNINVIAATASLQIQTDIFMRLNI